MSLKEQPRAVWAVAFACVIAFMGIGLVDPILPVLGAGSRRHAEPGVAAVHELLRDHRRLDARHRLRLEPDRPAQDAARRARARHRLQRARRRAGSIPRSSASAPAGASATRSSSPPRSGDHGLGDRRRRPARSSSSRPRSGSASPPARCWRTARRHLLARPVLRHRGADGDRVRRDPRAAEEIPKPRAQGRRWPTRPRPPASRAADDRARRDLLELRLLHAARLRAVRAGVRQHADRRMFFGWGLLLAFTSVFAAPRLKRRFGDVATLGAMWPPRA